MKFAIAICLPALMLGACSGGASHTSAPPIAIVPTAQGQTSTPFPQCQNTDLNPAPGANIHGEGVCQVTGSPSAFTIRYEAVWSPTPGGYQTVTLPLKFPPNKTIKQLSGILTYYSDCDWQPPSLGNVVLNRIFVSKAHGENEAAYTWAIKSSKGQGQAVPILSMVPVNTMDGEGRVSANIGAPAGCLITIEMQAQMQIE